MQAFKTLCAAMVLVFGIASVSGCESDAQTGAVLGAGIGAIAGQAIGGDTEATLIGTAVGTGVGYLIGNEGDKKKAERMSQPPPARKHPHDEVGDLGGTRWRLVSVNPDDAIDPWVSQFVEFMHNGSVETITTNHDGSVITRMERYRVVGSTLILNHDDYIINARYGIQGNQLVISAPDFSMVYVRL